MTERIPADGGLTIETDLNRWRLLTGANGDARALVEAAAGAPLRYAADFGIDHQLPPGSIATEQVDRIVLGYAPEDSAWVLGLVLLPAFTQMRGSRWCEIARWRDQSPYARRATAERAGQALAQQIMRPYAVIPPKPPVEALNLAPIATGIVDPAPSEPQAAPAIDAQSTISTSEGIAPVHPAAVYTLIPDRTASGQGEYPAPALDDTPMLALPTPELDAIAPSVLDVRPPPPVYALPLRLDDWTLRDERGTLELRLASSWGRGKLLRALWYLVWTCVFVALTVTTLTGPIALPRAGLPCFRGDCIQAQSTFPPLLLPILGIICAVVLFILAIAHIVIAARAIKRIVIDDRARTVTAYAGGQRWQLPAEAIEAVYASQVVNRVNRRANSPARRAVYAELNLLERNGPFRHLVSAGGGAEPLPAAPLPLEAMPDLLNVDGVTPLTAREAYTPAQAAALMIAEALGVPARDDQRIK